MKIDLYTKAVLTVIAIGVGLLVLEQNPIKKAHAAFGGSEVITAGASSGNDPMVWHLKGGKLRHCFFAGQGWDYPPKCGAWSK